MRVLPLEESDPVVFVLLPEDAVADLSPEDAVVFEVLLFVEESSDVFVAVLSEARVESVRSSLSVWNPMNVDIFYSQLPIFRRTRFCTEMFGP